MGKRRERGADLRIQKRDGDGAGEVKKK